LSADRKCNHKEWHGTTSDEKIVDRSLDEVYCECSNHKGNSHGNNQRDSKSYKRLDSSEFEKVVELTQSQEKKKHIDTTQEGTAHTTYHLQGPRLFVDIEGHKHLAYSRIQILEWSGDALQIFQKNRFGYCLQDNLRPSGEELAADRVLQQSQSVSSPCNE
jgi:hypothetical protein